jgi:hypothetical protein
MAISNLVVSAHAVCYINSVPLARCCGLSYDISSPRKEVRGIDVLEPVEFIITGLSFKGTLQIYKLKDDGGAEAAGLIPTWNKMTQGKYFSLQVLDRTTDGVLIQVDKCEVLNQSWSVVPKSFVLGTITFSGFSYSNNSE